MNKINKTEIFFDIKKGICRDKESNDIEKKISLERFIYLTEEIDLDFINNYGEYNILHIKSIPKDIYSEVSNYLTYRFKILTNKVKADKSFNLIKNSRNYND